MARLLIASLIISIILLSPRALAFSPEEENALREKGLEAVNNAIAVPLKGDRQTLVFQRYSIEFTPPKDFTVKEVANAGISGMMYLFEGKQRASGAGAIITAIVTPDDNIQFEPQPELEVIALESTLKPWKKTLLNYAESDKQFTVGKNLAKGKTFSGNLNGRAFNGLAAASKVNKGMWVFFTLDPADEFAKTQEIFVQMLKTCELAGEKSQAKKLETKPQTFTYGTHSLIMTPPAGYIVREIVLPLKGRVFAFVGPTREDKTKGTLTVSEVDSDDSDSVEPALQGSVAAFKRDASDYASEQVKVKLGDAELTGIKFTGRDNGGDKGGFAVAKNVKGALWIFLVMDFQKHLEETETEIRKVLEQARVN